MPQISHHCPQCGSNAITRPKKDPFIKMLRTFVNIYKFKCKKCSRQFFKRSFF